MAETWSTSCVSSAMDEFAVAHVVGHCGVAAHSCCVAQLALLNEGLANSRHPGRRLPNVGPTRVEITQFRPSSAEMGQLRQHRGHIRPRPASFPRIDRSGADEFWGRLDPKSASICPESANVARKRPISPAINQSEGRVDRVGSEWTQIRPTCARTRPTLTRNRPDLARNRSRLAQNQPNVSELGQIPPKLPRSLPNCAPAPGKVGPKLGTLSNKL